MVSADTARTILGVLGNIISLCVFLSPVPTFVQIWKKKAVEQYSPVPYLATLVNCMMWALYGLPIVHPNSLLVLTINGAGTGIEIVYIIIFLIYTAERQKRLRVLIVLLIEATFITVLTVLVLTVSGSFKERSMIVGIMCIMFNIMMYASPLAVMKLVLATKSVEYMPFFLSLACFANGVIWLAYGLIRFDPFIVVPNGIGTLFGLAQLILYALFYKSTKRQIAERKSKGEVDLSGVMVVDGEDSRKVGSAPQNGRP
ncbi:bidirectional sugar transporter SWEET7 isoform X1 [Quercus suber]|uniref:bidirectional sugar transporter SWEET7 isoform X1 n=1 Tax=Quercus suber TaxID=58331 RepID=UPI000CE1D991|nr:bidirectional sugar transporter SWEET7 isoform X1 [Quercus suber]POE50349.1 bidirectional sugar transporter sweet7 [Quercus suber]